MITKKAKVRVLNQVLDLYIKESYICLCNTVVPLQVNGYITSDEQVWMNCVIWDFIDSRHREDPSYSSMLLADIKNREYRSKWIKEMIELVNKGEL